MKSIKLAIIGTAEGQKQLYIKAKEKGIYTIAFSYNRGCIPPELIDEYYEISIINKDTIVEKCKEICVDGVISNGSELTANIASYVAYKLNLECTPYNIITNLQNKYKTRLLTECIEELHPIHSYMFNSNDRKPHFLPCVVKPVTGSGKNGVSFADNNQEFQNAVNYALEASNTPVLVEEFIQGREVSVESISFQGKHYVIQITDKDSSGAPHFVELGHHQPSNLPDYIQKKIRNIIPKILEAVGYVSGASHSELKISEDGKIYLIEINPRGGGDEISNRLVYLSTGYDYIGAMIDVAIRTFHEPVLGDSKCSGIVFLTKQTEQLLPLFKKAHLQPWYVDGAIESIDLKECKGNASKNGYIIYQSENRII
ncbi:ATP-grasp domain-containing protein [Bacteroides mediterraneensis]|uniref:ATP-grasp domain-containing protein n=1 Tax=Bacteroides mediterraneensis TaxID=1841856 RepID=UPI00195866DC|nr:ATP-grasp domain-containing protein [Bacteroides mediterraneensis]MBM6781263.1 ATP-grasp domain-containing protein [Bacteroides mediterraneensis]